MMPPPNSKSGPAKKKRQSGQQPLISAPTLIHHTHSTSLSMAGPVQTNSSGNKDDYENDSDSAYGFGNGWQN